MIVNDMKMKKSLITGTLILFCFGLIVWSCTGNDSHTETQTDTVKPIEVANGIVPDTHCVTAPASWLAGKMTPAPDDYGPFVDQKTTTNCDFHLWSWQKFLSLVRCVGCQKAPFEGLVQVDNDLMVLPGGMLQLTDSSQAGTGGTLYDKQAHAIYYSIYVNDQILSFQQKNLAAFSKAIGTLTSTAQQNAALHQNGLDTLTYPVGSIELKASWILSSSLSDPQNYYQTKAKLTTAAGTREVKVALLGMHIIGRVANHPEFIWATFEHNGLAPDYDWASGKDTINKVLSTDDFVFYAKNTPVKDCPMNNSKGNPASPAFSSIFNMFSNGMARSFTSNDLPTHADSVNNANILALNKSVLGQLSGKSEVWKNYFYKGAMWLDNTVPGSFGPGDYNLGLLTNPALKGSRAISNISMETFAQLNYSGIYATGSMNCFGCHGTADFKNHGAVSTGDSLNYNLGVSHLFINALFQKLHKGAPKTP